MIPNPKLYGFRIIKFSIKEEYYETEEKVLAGLLAAAMTAGLLAGCGGEENQAAEVVDLPSRC